MCNNPNFLIFAKLISCIFILNLSINFIFVNAVDESKLKQFFSETYLRKETGYFSPKVKAFPPGFQMNWDWYHFHHVCIQRGKLGVYTGLSDFVNDWKNDQGSNNNSALYISEKEWNSAKLRNPNVNDFWHSQVELYEAKRIEISTVGKISVLEGGTLFFNCETPLSFQRYKQFDWMSKLGVFYELASYFMKNPDKQTFKFPWVTPFHHVLMNRCMDPTTYEWQLGASFFDLVKAKMESANLTKDGYTNFFRDEPKDTSNSYICVDDLYLSTRVQNFISNYDVQVEFRNDASRMFGIPKEKPEVVELPVEVPQWVRLPYCGDIVLARKYPTRIVYVKYKGNVESGSVKNSDDVIRLLQSLTSKSVDIVTVSSTKSFAAAVSTVFDSADIIVAPFGSLSLLGLFAKWPFTKIYVELTPYMHNPVFYRSYRRLNFADYVVSTGHYTDGNKKECPIRVVRDFNRLDCNISRHSFPKRSLQERYLCPWDVEKVFSCNMEVNLKSLRAQLVESIRHMCKNGTEWSELKVANKAVAGVVTKSRKYDTKHKFGKWQIFNPKKPRRMEIDVNGDRYPNSYTFTYENHSLYEKAMNLTNGVSLPPFKYYLTVLATFKNEGHIIEEWLEHHIAHGVEHFYLVNDHSTDNCMSLLAPYLENGIITMFNAPSVSMQFRQVALYRNSIVRIIATNESQWVAIIDLDEFLYSPQDVDIKNILRQHEDLSLIGLNWVWFGANNYAKQPGSVIQSFTKRAEYDISQYPEFLKRYKMMNPALLSPSNTWQKYILNLAYKVVDVDVHGANIEGTIDNLSYKNNIEDPVLLLNHYAVQSKEFFMAKGQKGDINNFRAPNQFTEEWFQVLSIDDVVDTRLADQNKKNSIAMRFVRDEDAAYQTLVKASPAAKSGTSDSSDGTDSNGAQSSSDNQMDSSNAGAAGGNSGENDNNGNNMDSSASGSSSSYSSNQDANSQNNFSPNDGQNSNSNDVQNSNDGQNSNSNYGQNSNSNDGQISNSNSGQALNGDSPGGGNGSQGESSSPEGTGSSQDNNVGSNSFNSQSSGSTSSVGGESENGGTDGASQGNSDQSSNGNQGNSNDNNGGGDGGFSDGGNNSGQSSTDQSSNGDSSASGGDLNSNDNSGDNGNNDNTDNSSSQGGATVGDASDAGSGGGGSGGFVSGTDTQGGGDGTSNQGFNR